MNNHERANESEELYSYIIELKTIRRKKKGPKAQFGYRYLLLKAFMKPKFALPFLLDAHSFWTGSSV